MSTRRHGIAIGIERSNNVIYFFLKAQGQLTHDDYVIMTPMLDSAIASVEQPVVRALIDATELQGWELRAAWDDFKLGMKHNQQFEKIAIYGKRPWHHLIATIGNWFISGETAYFESETEALDWLQP